jgi:hypothetical protein
VGVLWRWHRRFGLLAAFFLLVLAVTGIVLNHTAALALDKRFIDWPWLSAMYGDNSANLPAYALAGRWLSRAANGMVYLDDIAVAPCSGKLVGALSHDDLLYAGCADALLLLTRDGALVESVNASTGLPTPLQALGLVDGQVVLQSADNWWLADLERLVFDAPAPPGAAVSGQLVPARLPAVIRARIPAPQQWLTWERMLLDLHSGRLFGRLGVLWVDLMGVLLGCLALSGFAMWWLHRRRA